MKRLITTAVALLLLFSDSGISIFASSDTMNVFDIENETKYEKDETIYEENGMVGKKIELTDEQRYEIDEFSEEYLLKKQKIQPRTIMGVDERITVANADMSIAKLIITWPDNTAEQGTAFLVGRGKYLLTAGHCLYRFRQKQWAKSVRVVPGSTNGSEPVGSYYATHIETDAEYPNAPNELVAKDYDWGIIRLDRKMPDNIVPIQTMDYFQMDHATLTAYMANGINIQGYPDSRVYSQSQAVHGMNTDVDYTARHIFYRIDTSGGQSGSPIRVSNSGGRSTNVAVGIHINGVDPQAYFGDRNFGVILDNDKINRAYDFMNRYP